MAGTIVVDTIQSDSSYASKINVTSNVAFTSPVSFNTATTFNTSANFVGGVQVGGQDVAFGGMRNRIINGGMIFDQRYNGGGNTLVSGSETFVVDRFVGYKDAGVITSGQSSVAPTGFSKSISWSVGTGATASSNQYFFLKQHIEGYNTADLGFGTASASTVTFSFWVRASITGTYSGSLNNGAADRSYGFTYTINQANTWEYKSVTIPGDTSGTWVGATNGTGLRVYWDLGCHSGVRNSSAGVWNSGALVGVAGTTSLSATTGATFYVTGVQLEKGSSATGFEYRQYGTEFSLCQRYYIKTFDGSTYGSGSPLVNTITGSSTRISIPTTMVPMRANPTVTVYNGSGTSGNLTEFSSASNKTVSSVNVYGTIGGGYCDIASLSNPVIWAATYSAEL